VKSVRIGGASAFWGDTDTAPAQLLRHGRIDYLVFDYLAEVTMSILVGARAKNPDAGYAVDFVQVIAPLLRELAEKKVKVVANAGGVNPLACRDALAKACAQAGVPRRIAVVLGDDLMPRLESLRPLAREMASGAALPSRPLSMNAYLGARPIAAALNAGADIVITGRCVDSAVTLGPLMHEFGWSDTDYDRLSAGSLAGHVIECGTQATGALFTDWREVSGYDDMGFPVIEVSSDGRFTVEKPPETGGLVTPASVGEQMLYEIGDPRAYLLPDVSCDFTQVRFEQVAPGKVSVSGAIGRPPTDRYKVSTTWMDGFKAVATFVIVGREAPDKARAVAEAILAKTRRRFRAANLGDYRAVDIDVLGAETTWGTHARRGDTREVMAKIAVHHDQKPALEIFGREIAPAATGMAPGFTGLLGGGRPKAMPMIRLYSWLVPKSEVPIEIEIDGARSKVSIVALGDFQPPAAEPERPAAMPDGPRVTVPLIRLAWGRSGDKGDVANIGLIARRPEFAEAIREQVTAKAVADWFGHCVKGKVTRHELPGLSGFNFVLEQALGGGGVASLRTDPLAKTFAQVLLDMPIEAPKAWGFERDER